VRSSGILLTLGQATWSNVMTEEVGEGGKKVAAAGLTLGGYVARIQIYHARQVAGCGENVLPDFATFVKSLISRIRSKDQK